MAVPFALDRADDLALLICDLQNDFIHPRGAYGRAGMGVPAIAAVPARVAPIAAAMRRAGGLVIGTMFTLVPGRDGDPLIAPHLKAIRPFLAKGDFAPGSWGQSMVDGLGPFDGMVEKVAYSAYLHTRLDWLLRRLGIARLVVCGIVTNGGVASTLRDAFARDYPLALLADGCAAFDPAMHEATIKSLSGMAAIMTCAELTGALDRIAARR